MSVKLVTSRRSLHITVANP